MEFLPDLFWIEGRASNIYLWRDESGLVMVDTGMPGDAKKILAYIEQAGFQPSDVTAILVTHADMDHAGSAAELNARCEAPIYAGSETAELLTAGKSPKHLPRVIQIINDRLIAYKPVAAERIRVIEDGQSVPDLPAWRAMATPGHCGDHYSFTIPVHGILFAGDALNTRGGRLQLSSKRITADQAAARQSAMRLLQLTPVVFACGHGRPMSGHSAEDVMMLFHDLSYADAQHTGSAHVGATGG